MMKIINSEYKLLIVDQSKEVLSELEDILINHDFKVIKAQKGNEAIELLQTEYPDLIISGVRFSDISGFEICNFIRKKPNEKRIPLIYLTTKNDSESIVQAFEVGADDYVLKPYDPNVLVARIRHQLLMLRVKRTILQKNMGLRESIQVRDRMYSVIAHDLRSPISTIKMIMNFLLQNKSVIDEQTFMKMLEDTNYITEEVFSLLDNLLKWTRLQTDTLSPIFQEIDLAEVVKGSLGLIKKITSLKNIEVELKSISKAKVYVDIEMIKSCIRNLISNAYKYSYNDNKIIISLEEDFDSYILGIQDFGCGINKDSASKLLNIKTHYSTNGTAHEQGSGLGLLLVKELVEKNGGKLWFETREGFGSKFFISLPKSDKEIPTISYGSVLNMNNQKV